MDNKQAAKLISDNLRAVYGYAFGRLYDKNDVDDLVSEILVNALSNAEKIKDEQAFWGYFWRVAETTFTRFIKKKNAEGDTEELSEMSGTVSSAENEYIENNEKNELIYLLRRELSLLSQTHREVTVAYYMQGKTCSQIASEQNLSVEMVKYHLFKTRKLLKEGIGMERKYGEKSYNPGVFRLNFWGDSNHYNTICNRRLPGSILLSAYYAPMTDKELSLELGVSMPYLEEELKILTDAGLLLKNNDKYQTNLVILTEDFEKELAKKVEGKFKDNAKAVYEEIKALLPKIKMTAYEKTGFDGDCVIISLMNIAFVNAFEKTDEKYPYGEYKTLPLGGRGFLWGHDNNYDFCKFSGVAMHVSDDENSSWFSTENYRVLKNCSYFFSHGRFGDNCKLVLAAIDEKTTVKAKGDALKEILTEGIVNTENGRLSANFPVFDEDEYNAIVDTLSPVIEKVIGIMKDYSDTAAALLSEHCPPSVRDRCDTVAAINYRLDTAAIIFETLIKDGVIAVPNEKKPLTLWGVKK